MPKKCICLIDDREIIGREDRLCLCCMEKHEVVRVRIVENNVFKGVLLEYIAEYDYCDKTKEMLASEEQMAKNYIAMKNAYHHAVDKQS